VNTTSLNSYIVLGLLIDFTAAAILAATIVPFVARHRGVRGGLH